MGSVLANSELCELFEKSRGAKRAGCGANSPDRSLFSICVRRRMSRMESGPNFLTKARPAGLEPATPGLEGKPDVPDAFFFSVGCGFTHADSPRACRYMAG